MTRSEFKGLKVEFSSMKLKPQFTSILLNLQSSELNIQSLLFSYIQIWVHLIFEFLNL